MKKAIKKEEPKKEEVVKETNKDYTQFIEKLIEQNEKIIELLEKLVKRFEV